MKLLVILSALFLAHALHVANPLGSPAYALTRAAGHTLPMRTVASGDCMSIEDGIARVLKDNSKVVSRATVGKLLKGANGQHIKVDTNYPAEAYGFYIVAFSGRQGTVFGSFPVDESGCLLDSEGRPSKHFVWVMMNEATTQEILSHMPDKNI